MIYALILIVLSFLILNGLIVAKLIDDLKRHEVFIQAQEKDINNVYTLIFDREKGERKE